MSSSASSILPAPTFPKLDETNYHSWKFNMQALLMHNMAWLIINGTLEEPSNRANTEWRDWAIGNSNAAGIIYLQVEPSIQPLIREHLSSAVKMWDTLKEHFSKDNAASRFLVFDEFLSIAKAEDESLSALTARVDDSL